MGPSATTLRMSTSSVPCRRSDFGVSAAMPRQSTYRYVERQGVGRSVRGAPADAGSLVDLLAQLADEAVGGWLIVAARAERILPLSLAQLRHERARPPHIVRRD